MEAQGENKNFYKLEVDGDAADVDAETARVTDMYNNMIKTSTKLVIVDFSATWCGPCKTIGPAFKNMAAEFPNCVMINVDVDDFEQIAEDAEINCMPTFQFFKGGDKIDEFSGANKDKLKEMINKHYNS